MLARCTHCLVAQGARLPMAPLLQEELQSVITDMAGRGLRTLALAYSDLPPEVAARGQLPEEPPEQGMTLLAVVGIKVWAGEACHKRPNTLKVPKVWAGKVCHGSP